MASKRQPSWSRWLARPSAFHDATNRVLPPWLSQVGDPLIQANQFAEFTTGGSCLVVDTRDTRLVSPFQGLFPIEIHDNALSSVNILTERFHDTPTLFNPKLRLKGEVLLHFEFAAYHSDFDMTVTRSHVNPNLLQFKAVLDLEVAQKNNNSAPAGGLVCAAQV